MKIFLAQHGHALSEDEDPFRPLSARGKAQVERMAWFLKKLPFGPGVILHSGKARSRETAEIVSLLLGGVRLEARDCIDPGDSPDQLLEELETAEENMMVAGHMPFLSLVTSKILFKGDSEQRIDLTNASPLIIDRTAGVFLLECYIKNDLIK